MAEFAEAADELRAKSVHFIFGGAFLVVELARKLNCFYIKQRVCYLVVKFRRTQKWYESIQ